MTGKSQGKQFQNFAMNPVYRRMFSHVLNTWPVFLVPLAILTLGPWQDQGGGKTLPPRRKDEQRFWQ